MISAAYQAVQRSYAYCVCLYFTVTEERGNEKEKTTFDLMRRRYFSGVLER